ncbi:prealbumin-like fold domain-containing protein [Lysobacter sp. CA196]|uniref:prealbumin-like fold domain-containing protein n=1 Tax=Lysobacter sp. CA196 TaxID=3455606 RepID=UPI003F8D84A3
MTVSDVGSGTSHAITTRWMMNTTTAQSSIARSKSMRHVVALLVCFSLWGGSATGVFAAESNGVPTGFGSNTPFPSGVTVNVTAGGTGPTTYSGTGGHSATTNSYFDPPINIAQLTYRLITPGSAVLAVGSEQQAGTLTFTFSRPVTNPRFHVTEWSAGNNGRSTTAWTVDTAVTPGATLTALGPGAGTRLVVGTAPTGVPGQGMPRVRSNFNSGGGVVDCLTSASAGCGTFQVNGTYRVITFFVANRMNAIGAGATETLGPDGYGLSITIDDDVSDAPASYGAAQHAISGLFMGTASTPAAGAHPGEADTVNTVHYTTAALDASNPLASTTANSDGDNAFASLPPVGVGTYTLSVPVSGFQTVPGATPQLCGWIDFNRNGAFETGERACAAVIGNGNVALSWTIPTGATYIAGESYARLRLGYTTTEVQIPTVSADSGEVEDYPITLLPRVRLTKTLAPASDPGLFNLSVAPASATAVQTNSGAVANVGNGGTTDWVPVPLATLITVSEIAGTGTSLSNYSSSIACTDRSGATVTLGAAGTTRTFFSLISAPVGPPTTPNSANASLSEISCIATNTRLPTVQVVKVTQNGVGTFSFSGTNGIANHDITTVTAGTGVAGPVQVLTTAGTATTVTEAPLPAGYLLGGISCSGLGAGGTASNDLPNRSVTLNAAATVAGSAIVCTYTNIAQVADLVIAKTNTPLAGDNDQANDSLVRGATTQYSLRVTNNGPVSVTGAIVRDAPGSGLNCPAGNVVTCSSATAGACPTSPSPILISDLATGVAMGAMPVGAVATFSFSCTVL